jgi:hypothetical protein
MVMAYRFGQMVQDMKENGRKIRHMEKENSGMLMVMFLKEIGKMIKLMDTGSTLM